VNIELSFKVNISFIEIINIHGSLIKSQSIANNQHTIDVSDLLVGIYILRIYAENGIAMKKLIKQ